MNKWVQLLFLEGDQTGYGKKKNHNKNLTLATQQKHYWEMDLWKGSGHKGAWSTSVFGIDRKDSRLT